MTTRCEHSLCELLPVSFQTGEAIHRRAHHGRVWDDLADEGLAFMVQDGGLSGVGRLNALVRSEIRR